MTYKNLWKNDESTPVATRADDVSGDRGNGSLSDPSSETDLDLRLGPWPDLGSISIGDKKPATTIILEFSLVPPSTLHSGSNSSPYAHSGDSAVVDRVSNQYLTQKVCCSYPFQKETLNTLLVSIMFNHIFLLCDNFDSLKDNPKATTQLLRDEGFGDVQLFIGDYPKQGDDELAGHTPYLQNYSLMRACGIT
ncbi:hypothetical protein M231_07352 [Tremella mesenterica]|uniref:Uncharacterized protein n=1 Tax=Tremella mesenterica TaxID=5217 RepID=A0A4Q1B9F1_TREME|nr:hypothetical protein M231_07352 [Tremella mesenterica]